MFALTIAATIRPEPERSWRFLSLWLVAMILLSPTAHGHYLILASVPFAAIADAARQGEVAPRGDLCRYRQLSAGVLELPADFSAALPLG